jgi:hypothetical protein
LIIQEDEPIDYDALRGNGSNMVFEIDLCFEALESSQDEIWKTIDGLMENQKKTSSMMEEMWKFQKSNASVHGSGSKSKGKKNLVKKVEQDVGSMGEVCSTIYFTANYIHVLHCLVVPYKILYIYWMWMGFLGSGLIIA